MYGSEFKSNGFYMRSILNTDGLFYVSSLRHNESAINTMINITVPIQVSGDCLYTSENRCCEFVLMLRGKVTLLDT